MASLPRPGGLDATEKAAQWAAVSADSRVLVPGCGRAASPVFLARTFRCRVLGVTASPDDLAPGREEAKRQGVEALVTLEQGDPLTYPYPSSEFDMALLEGSLSRTPEPERLLERLRPALRSGGFLIVSDIAAESPPPADVAELLRAVGYLGELSSVDSFAARALGVGLHVDARQPMPAVLPLLLRELRAKLSVAELPVALGLVPIKPRLFAHIKDLLERCIGLSDEGALQFFVLVASNPPAAE